MSVRLVNGNEIVGMQDCSIELSDKILDMPSVYIDGNLDELDGQFVRPVSYVDPKDEATRQLVDCLLEFFSQDNVEDILYNRDSKMALVELAKIGGALRYYCFIWNHIQGDEKVEQEENNRE